MILKHCKLHGAFTGGVSGDDCCVEIEAGKIKSVTSCTSEDAVRSICADVNGDSATAICDFTDVYDCKGMTLLPGLIDLHTHITFLSGVGVMQAHDSMQLLVEAAGQATRYLEHGFTTIRDCGSISRSANYVKRMINRGIVNGPDIIACGSTLMPSVTASGGVGDITHYCDGAEEFRKAVREEVAAQANFIKIYASGSAFSPTGTPKHPIMVPEEIKMAVDTARANGLYVAAHCHADSAIRDCVEAGVRTIEHATYLSEETTDLLLETKDCYLVPTLSAMHVSQTDPKEREFWLARLTPMLESCAKTIGYAYRQGALIGFGTDSAPMSPQYATGVEFRFRKEYCEMDNLDILLQATVNSAKIAGIDDVGEIKPGMKANLILVDGDPVEDLAVMYQAPTQVWKNGISQK
jgi:imidazolonepropionase-like amidohydrolase